MAMHIRACVANAPDLIPVTDQTRDDFTLRLNTWWNTVKAHVAIPIKLHEYRFYDVPDVAGNDMGDPVDVRGVDSPATAATTPCPPQCAISVTLRTDQRKTWGRNYLPGVPTGNLDSKGRLLQSTATELAAAWHELTRRNNTGGCLVVFSRKEWTHHDPQTIQVDDIVDVIRTRRFSAPHFREQLSAG